jgi:hypothetical protein
MTKPTTLCDQTLSLPRAQLTAPDASLQQHLRECRDCASLVEVIALTRSSLPTRISTSEQVNSLKKELRERATAPQKRSPWRLRVALSVAAVFVLTTVFMMELRHKEPTPPKPASQRPAPQESLSWVQLSPQPGADFSQKSTPTEELISLQSGTLELKIGATTPSQRLKLRVSEDELVAISAHFFVTAAYGLESVEVKSGAVEIIPAIGKKQLLTDGEHWQAPPKSPPEAPIKTPTKLSNKPSNAAPTSTPTLMLLGPEIAFQEGVSAMKEGRFIEASAHFEEASKSPSLSQEALFFQAVSLNKADLSAEAKVTLSSFLTLYPDSSHAGEAHAALGWMLFNEGNAEEARPHFTAALSDKANPIRESAERGLKRIESAQ